MEGPHRTTGQGAALLPAPAQPGCLKIRGKRNAFKERTAGVGPDFQVVGGEGRLCRSRTAFTLEGLKEGAMWTKPRKRKRECREGRPLGSGENHRRRAVESVGIADPAAVSGVERRRNDPPPKGRCPSGGGRGGQPRRGCPRRPRTRHYPPMSSLEGPEVPKQQDRGLPQAYEEAEFDGQPKTHLKPRPARSA